MHIGWRDTPVNIVGNIPMSFYVYLTKPPATFNAVIIIVLENSYVISHFWLMWNRYTDSLLFCHLMLTQYLILSCFSSQYKYWIPSLTPQLPISLCSLHTESVEHGVQYVSTGSKPVRRVSWESRRVAWSMIATYR